MTKSELIEAMAEAAGITKAQASRALEGMLEAITEALKRGEQVSLVGFGTFAVRERAARTGRNPRTGETIEIKAARIPTFKPGKGLRDAVE
ncbi:MAG: HU family DNA-binding protein [Gammaproteobacteria bacterium]|nr:MAG: HU family DNA-binding protein [Gammaproteobacteria bacterium]